MPLHYNLILCDSNAFVCIFSVQRAFITGSFHPARWPSPRQPPAGLGLFQPGLSPGWARGQRQPSIAVCVRLSYHLVGSEIESCCPKQGRRSLWPISQVPCAPLSHRFLSQPSCGCQFFLLTAHLTSGIWYPLCSESSALWFHHHVVTRPYPCHAIGSIWQACSSDCNYTFSRYLSSS